MYQLNMPLPRCGIIQWMISIVLSSHSLGKKTCALLPDRPTAISMQFEQYNKTIQDPNLSLISLINFRFSRSIILTDQILHLQQIHIFYQVIFWLLLEYCLHIRIEADVAISLSWTMTVNKWLCWCFNKCPSANLHSFKNQMLIKQYKIWIYSA